MQEGGDSALQFVKSSRLDRGRRSQPADLLRQDRSQGFFHQGTESNQGPVHRKKIYPGRRRGEQEFGDAPNWRSPAPLAYHSGPYAPATAQPGPHSVHHSQVQHEDAPEQDRVSGR